MTKAEKIDALVEGLKLNVQPPRGFAFWSPGMCIAWLAQHQAKAKRPDKRARKAARL